MDDLLNVDQVLQMLGVSRKTLWTLTHSMPPDRRLPAIRLGNRLLRFKRSEIEAWLTRSRVNSGVGVAQWTN
jgi:excisionase family DNA binding protein